MEKFNGKSVWRKKETEIWSKRDEAALKSGVGEYGLNNWEAVAKRCPGKSARSCKEQWSSLSSICRKGDWKETEDKRLRGIARSMPAQFGSAALLLGRPASHCKDRSDLLDKREMLEAGTKREMLEAGTKMGKGGDKGKGKEKADTHLSSRMARMARATPSGGVTAGLVLGRGETSEAGSKRGKGGERKKAGAGEGRERKGRRLKTLQWQPLQKMNRRIWVDIGPRKKHRRRRKTEISLCSCPLN